MSSPGYSRSVATLISCPQAALACHAFERMRVLASNSAETLLSPTCVTLAVGPGLGAVFLQLCMAAILCC